MPKKQSRNEKKRAEAQAFLEEIKKQAPDAENEIKELEALLESLIEESCKPWYKRVLHGMLEFSKHFVIMYIASMLMFGFFFGVITVDNKWYIFAIGAVVSVILTLYGTLPRNPMRKHFFTFNIMILGLILIGFALINMNYYRIFQFTTVWLFYIPCVFMFYIGGVRLTQKLSKQEE